MRAKLWIFALIGLLTLAPLGCEPRPINTEPDKAGEVQIDTEDESRKSGVEVRVGGGEGVDVKVDPDRGGASVEVGGDRGADR
jgi:hypothetical protein